MSCLGKKKRNQVSNEIQVQPVQDPEDVDAPCETEEPESLLRLDVSGAIESGPLHWEVLNDRQDIKLTAVTDPNQASVWDKLVWEPGNLQVGANASERLFSRKAVTQAEVKVQLGGQEKSRTIQIVDLTKLESEDLPAVQGKAQTWRAYRKAGDKSPLTATTDPHGKEVWRQLVWSEGTTVVNAENKQEIALDNARTAHVTARLGQNPYKELAADVQICQWPELEVEEVEFLGTDRTTVEKDTKGDFDNKWIGGRADKDQSPLSYRRGKDVELAAKFKVKTKPTVDEAVEIKATADVGGTQVEWVSKSPHLVVSKNATSVSLAKVKGSATLPDKVNRHEVTIDWQMSQPDKSWKSIGSTKHVFYLTLAKPDSNFKHYWTMLDISCRAAKDVTAADGLVDELIKDFGKHTGDGKGYKRLRDSVRLSYYKKAAETDGTGVFTAKDLLDRADGTGRCGAWANFFVHCLRLHGIADGAVFGVVPKTAQAEGFHVEKCSYSGGGTKSPPFPHKGQTECVKGTGLAGMGKTNPQFLFADHALVDYKGKIYDPSYGAGPKADLEEWEKGAIAGLGKGGYGTFTQDGFVQAMYKECSKGFIEHKVSSGDKIAALASHYGVSSGNALYDHSFNAAFRGVSPDRTALKAGETILIPREIATITILKKP